MMESVQGELDAPGEEVGQPAAVRELLCPVAPAHGDPQAVARNAGAPTAHDTDTAASQLSKDQLQLQNEVTAGNCTPDGAGDN